MSAKWRPFCPGEDELMIDTSGLTLLNELDGVHCAYSGEIDHVEADLYCILFSHMKTMNFYSRFKASEC